MNDIQTKLARTMGLTNTEADIYVAALSEHSIGAAEIVKLTNIKRTTVYHALDTLCYKGLASRKGAGGKAVYTMLSPNAMQHAIESEQRALEERKKDLSAIVAELSMIKKNSINATLVDHYSGLQGVKAVYEEALYCKSREWRTITPANSFLGQYGQDFRQYVNKKRQERGVKTFALWENTRAKLGNTLPDKNRLVRIMPPKMDGRFTTKVILFDTKVALVTPAKDASAILINSREVYSTFNAIFETLWDTSTPAKIV